ncbi:MAG TPA: ABC transporter substrate-binding protein [Phototrophicaceae bacterium]|nr:ABC transporter substrate-binding protein [Phototrophicaceae bacterium]
MRTVLKCLALALVVMIVAVPVAAQDGNTFTFGEFGNPVNLDTAVVTDGISFRTAQQGCETLLAFDGATTNPIANLATEWTTSEDGKTWTFKLVENAKFTDGTPFNAEAVKWNFDRWRFVDNPEHRDEEGQVFEYYEAMFNGFDDASLITDVEATSEFEVTFTLSEPNGSLLNTLAMPMFSIHSPAAIEANGATYGTPEVGYVCTGPYKFVEWVSDDHVTLERNADYWGDFPGNVDTVIFRIIPDNAARFAALQAGEIDAFEQPNVEDLAAIESSDSLYLMMRPPLNVSYLAFSYRIKELRDPKVRQALALSIDRQAIVDAFYPPGAVAAATMLPPSLWGYNPDITVFPYDPEGAKALLAEAGFPDGLSEVNVLKVDADGKVTDEVEETIPLRLYYMPVARPYNPDGEGIGEAMAAQMAEAGVTVELTSAGDWQAYLAARSAGELLGLYQLGWTGDNGDPDNFLGYFYLSNPVPREGYYENAEVGALLAQARGSAAQADREPLYQQVEALQNAEVARLYVAHTGVPLAFSNRVSGYVPNPVSTEHFKLVTVQ